jgi:glutaredoxin
MRFRLMRWFRPKGDSPGRAVSVVLYKRTGCHLCDVARELLGKFQAEFRLTIVERDIDSDPELLARYKEKVPVVEVQGKERFFGHVHETLLRRLLHAEQRKLSRA